MSDFNLPPGVRVGDLEQTSGSDELLERHLARIDRLREEEKSERPSAGRDRRKRISSLNQTEPEQSQSQT